MENSNKLIKENNANKQVGKEILMLLRTILRQNYCLYENTFYTPNTGIAIESL
jgi:hypothetical protein